MYKYSQTSEEKIIIFAFFLEYYNNLRIFIRFAILCKKNSKLQFIILLINNNCLYGSNFSAFSSRLNSLNDPFKFKTEIKLNFG